MVGYEQPAARKDVVSKRLNTIATGALTEGIDRYAAGAGLTDMCVADVMTTQSYTKSTGI